MDGAAYKEMIFILGIHKDWILLVATSLNLENGW